MCIRLATYGLLSVVATTQLKLLQERRGEGGLQRKKERDTEAQREREREREFRQFHQRKVL